MLPEQSSRRNIVGVYKILFTDDFNENANRVPTKVRRKQMEAWGHQIEIIGLVLRWCTSVCWPFGGQPNTLHEKSS